MPLPERRIPAQFESRIEIAEGLVIIRLALADDFHFKAGQYATLWLTHKGKTVPRPYSISSSPSQTRVLEFYINLVEEGRLTPSFWDPEVLSALQNHRNETDLAVTGPKGRFVLDPDDPRDLVFVASGTGLGPFMSMIRKMREDYSVNPEVLRPRRVYVVHGASYSSHLGYRDELQQMAIETMREPGRKLTLIYLPTVSRANLEPSWHGLTGRAETLFEPCIAPNGAPSLQDTVKGMLAAILSPKTHVVYVCGHPGTVDGVMKALLPRGFQPDVDLMREKYYP